MEYKSFYKEVKAGEGTRCKYPTRLDTYGCGCAHDCNYCYAKSLLEFRNMWNPFDPAEADITKVYRRLDKVQSGSVLRLGGMTDCFQPCERERLVTYKTIQALNRRGIGYLIVTKSDMVAEDDYIDVMDKDLAHIQITVTCLDDELYRNLRYENAPLPSDRIRAIKRLQDEGFDVAIRLSPLIEQFIDFDKLNSLGIRKGIVEFLRTNHWIKKWFDIDYSAYTLKEGGYQHLPLDEKLRILSKIKGMEISVCEDVTEHYLYWKEHFNPNKEDCCNLRA